jgi:hypothetical protein
MRIQPLHHVRQIRAGDLLDSVSSRLHQAFSLPILAAAVLMVLLGVLGVLIWPAWSESERLRRRAIVDALTGEARP